jgi:hypothetical protein
MSRTPSAATRWRAVIDDFHRSGLEHAEFYAHRGLSLHTFRNHVHGSQTATAPARFFPVGLTSPANRLPP